MLRHCSVRGFDCIVLSTCLLRHYEVSSRCPLFHYLFVSSLLCSGLPRSPLLCVTSLSYFFKASIVSLTVCYFIALFAASALSSSAYYVTMLYLKGVNCFSVYLLRHSSRLLLVASLLPLLGFYCLVFRWLRHGFHCYLLSLLLCVM